MRISCIILAAGASSRMGSPKPLLRFDGRTGVSLVLESCRESQGTGTVLVLGADAEPVRAALGPGEADGVTIVINERHERGQTSSFKAGLEAASPRSDGFLLLAVDMPLVTSADLDALIERGASRPRGRSIFIATHEGRRGHPALFLGSHREPLLALPDDEPLHQYIRMHEGEVDQVPVDNPGVVMPMNTPEEYQRVEALWRARRRGSAAS